MNIQHNPKFHINARRVFGKDTLLFYSDKFRYFSKTLGYKTLIKYFSIVLHTCYVEFADSSTVAQHSQNKQMNLEELRNHCLAVKNAEESSPFGEDVIVYKIMNKMFAFFSVKPKNNDFFVVMKCDPEKSAMLREEYEGVTKGFYAGNSLTWNSVYIQSDVPDKLIVELIAHSVEEVIKKLPKAKQKEYREM